MEMLFRKSLSIKKSVYRRQRKPYLVHGVYRFDNKFLNCGFINLKVMSVKEIGCCGAYCKTCMVFLTKGQCKGCKLGYDDGSRDLSKSKCAYKNCCFRDHHLETCADCPDYSSCELIHGFYAKNGYKYKKYQQAVEFIRANGYETFLKLADEWKGPYGKLF